MDLIICGVFHSEEEAKETKYIAKVFLTGLRARELVQDAIKKHEQMIEKVDK